MVGGPVLQERDPVIGDRLDELRLDAELRRDRLAHLDVEALDLAALRVLDAERRHVVLDADRHLALLLDLAQRRIRRELLHVRRRRRGRPAAGRFPAFVIAAARPECKRSRDEHCSQPQPHMSLRLSGG
jgi:hypothetical protein